MKWIGQTALLAYTYNSMVKTFGLSGSASPPILLITENGDKWLQFVKKYSQIFIDWWP